MILAMAMTVSIAVLGNAQGQQSESNTQNKMGMSMMQDCPMKVQGADLAVTDTKDGIALTITSKSGDVAELRRRVERMAKMHQTAGGPMMHQGAIPFTAKYEEIPNGARLTLTPAKAEQLSEFRAQVRKHAEQMQKGDCSMMQGMMQGMMGGMKPGESKPEAAPKPAEPNHETHH
jgi:hypothetical protein